MLSTYVFKKTHKHTKSYIGLMPTKEIPPQTHSDPFNSPTQ